MVREQVVRVEELSRQFGTKVAVDRVSFDIARSEVFGFLGPNGAGKTTTIKMLTTLLPPTSGRATVLGHDLWIQRPKNVRAEVDYQSVDGTKIAIFAFNEQDVRRRIHHARFLTVVQRRDRIDIGFDEARLHIWKKEELAQALRAAGFRPLEWWGDLRLGARYERSRSPRMVSVSTPVDV